MASKMLLLLFFCFSCCSVIQKTNSVFVSHVCWKDSASYSYGWTVLPMAIKSVDDVKRADSLIEVDNNCINCILISIYPLQN